MKPSAETLDRFKKIYKEEFGEELTDEDAFERFSRLINVVRIVVYGRLDTVQKGDNLGPQSQNFVKPWHKITSYLIANHRSQKSKAPA